VYASIGNYIFNSGCLVRVLRESGKHGENDFGHHVLPRMLKHRVFAYDFAGNAIPGLKPYEDIGYWRDVGSIDAYFGAHCDVLGAEPRFDLFNPKWPVYSSNYQGPVARIIRGEIDNCLLGSATVIENARLRNSIVRREAVVEEGAEIEDCIIMDYARIGRGAKLRRVIVDRHNLIEHNTRIGFDPEHDRQNYRVSPAGVAVVPRGRSPYFARKGRGSGIGYAE
jgi:glucose-1-phosphate adenylyltransferase